MVKASIDTEELLKGQVFEVKPNFLLTSEHPNLIVVSVLYDIQGEKHDCIPLVLICRKKVTKKTYSSTSEYYSVYLRKMQQRVQT